MNNTLKGYATETWVLKRLGKFKATSSSASGSQIVGSTHEHANKETLDKLTEEMINVLSTLSIDKDGHLCSSVGLYSQSFVSAFGLNASSGGSGGGGTASIIVNGNQYTPNADGVITLPDYPTSLTWSNIQGKPSWIGSTKPTYTASEVGALPSNHPASDVTSALITNWNAAYNWGNHASAGYLKSISKTSIINALGYTPFNNASFTKANIKSTLGISDWALAASKPTYSASEIVNYLGYTPFDKASFTKTNIKSTLGISDWALASSKPSYNLDEVTDGTSRKLSNYLLKSVFDDMFEKTTESGVAYIKAKYNLTVSGSILSTSNITAYSDARLKDDVKSLEYRGRLTPVTYVWKDNRSLQQIGFIAQDVQKLYPELVQDNNGLLSLNYQCVTAVLAAQLNAMEDEMSKMKREITELKEMIKQKI